VTSQSALIGLLRYLKSEDYRFIAVTPATHARVLARTFNGRPTHRDIFGWSRPFFRQDVEPPLFDLLKQSDALERDDSGKLRSRVRVATLGEHLFLHSAFPTDEPDSVFFGPDTYRFCRYAIQELSKLSPAVHITDMGAGTGAGGIVAAASSPRARITVVDVNERALQLAAANAAEAGVDIEILRSDTIPEGADLVIANPPYLMDDASRTYRDGGEVFGGQVSLDWTRQALASLPLGGVMLLYTGAAFVEGRSPLIEELQFLCGDAGALLETDEIDPDVFGEELQSSRYEKVERIAAIGVKITKIRGDFAPSLTSASD
jgi:methylase of polypeptide subunit release factors